MSGLMWFILGFIAGAAMMGYKIDVEINRLQKRIEALEEDEWTTTTSQR